MLVTATEDANQVWLKLDSGVVESLSPVGAESCSPGREPGVQPRRETNEPRRGDTRRGVAPTGLESAARKRHPGLTPGATRFRPYGAGKSPLI